ncbi:ABC transporter substrate-binding protein [Sporosarcina pasteurii]|uniref:Maltose/maltodextrin-binding protein n=1 Tax=Sporosarcina pasteurii TaxID=1474 RepID=A0A380BFK0_SPOPA|nr:ABC transporter substrate-binding protein [Sporosarcina pasteurii]MDS9472466.1 ABC transporter substrate-binding protein [Sporosarcina pasteurii]QBQ06022.1 carbohydrate ABC transporter substrate-binding protein [Sporosarcina pasteurii]SUI99657.1 Maltose/maltodextrin-binding protein precursor [Sporosarcina pasteurii]
MKFRKRLLSSLFIGVLMLILAACSGDSGGEGGKSNDGESGKSSDQKITIFQSKVEISDQLEALAKEYEEETGVEVEVWGTTGDDYFQQLQIRLNSDQGPSIFSLQNVTEAERLKSYVHDLSDEDYVEHIAPGMALELDGKVVGIPYGVEGFGLVYNKDLVSPEDVADYESFVKTLEKFKAEDINGLGLAKDAYFLIGHIINHPFSLQDDFYSYIDQLTAGDVTMAETETFQEFGKFMEAIKENTPSPLDVSYDEEIGDFAAGKSAMIHQGNWAYGMISDFDVDFEIGMLPLPLQGNDKLAVGVGSNWAINSEKDEAEVQAAVDFLNWLNTSETGHKYIVEEFGFVPALTNIEAGELDPLSQDVLDASNSGETIAWSQSYFPAGIVPNDFTPAAQEFFLSKDMTGQEFIEKLDAAWKNAVK